jgi:hypothetical protein
MGSFSKKIHKAQDRLFDIFIILSYISYGLILLGFSTQKPEYLIYLDNIVQMYISLFLIIRFNPFRELTFTNLDRKIAFSAGLFLLTTTTINSVFINYFDEINNYLKNLFGIKGNTLIDNIGVKGIGDLTEIIRLRI